ncbi:hypothetical protein IMSAG049_00414 [Clostridiales bacterium]|nr:hypothetical protein IMSAG049_00414 [Clostridiales bacterium]
MLYPRLKEITTYNITTDKFWGYNNGLRISQGELAYTKNLTSDRFPVLASRTKRGSVTTLSSPQGLAAKDCLIYVDGSGLYFNGNRVSGVVLSTLAENCPKKLVSMGAYLCIFPDNIYVNTADLTEYGPMEMSYETPSGSKVKYTLCGGDGKAMKTPVTAGKAPGNPQNGDLWIDTSDEVHVLRQYSEQAEMWVEMAATYVKIEASGIGNSVKKGDGVRIDGCYYSGSNTSLKKQINVLNGTRTIVEREDNYIVVSGIIDQTYTYTTTTSTKVTVKRKVPKMDFVTECQNRLWGCYYGIVDGKTVNEIFCCKLGDFKNWEAYAGISTDSFRASCGTDGQWTGAATYLGYPMFFKENYVHKVYVSAGGDHRIISMAIDGVQKGSENSIAIVNDCLVYKAPRGINVFDGTQAVCVSEALGDEMYFSAVGGRLGGKYYISMEDSKRRWHMFVYDMERKVWHREDDTYAMAFSDTGGELYYIDKTTGELVAVRGTEGVLENNIDWEAIGGIIGYEYAENKYLSRFKLRMSIEKDGWAEIYVQYDSDGEWRKAGVVRGMGINRTFVIPIAPRRCDHVQIKLKGRGEFKLYSISRVLEIGSDIRVSCDIKI